MERNNNKINWPSQIHLINKAQLSKWYITAVINSNGHVVAMHACIAYVGTQNSLPLYINIHLSVVVLPPSDKCKHYSNINRCMDE